MTRLSALISFAVFLAALLAAGTVTADPAGARDLSATIDPGLQRGLERVVRDLGLANEAGTKRLALALVDATDADAPRLAMLNGNEMMYAASLPKVAILLGAFAEAEAGRITLDKQHLDAMTRMIRYSSNEDASRVLGWVGEDRLLEILQSDRFRFYDAAGAGGLWVGKAYGRGGAFRRDPVRQLSHGATAYQVARLYYLLARDVLLSHRLNKMMKETLSNPGIQHKFVKGLESRPGVRIYRKSGTWKDFHADSALVEYGPHRYIIVGLAENPHGGDWLMRLAEPLHDLVVSPARVADRR